MVEETKFLCKRCEINLEKLNVVDVHGDLDNPVETFDVQVYGYVLHYDLYECPRCGELSFIRPRDQSSSVTSVLKMGDGTEPNVELQNRAITYRKALFKGIIKENHIPSEVLEEIKRMEQEDQQRWEERCSRCGEPSIGEFCSSCEKKRKEEEREYE